LTDDQLEVVHGDLHVVGLNESVGPFMMRDSGSVKLYCAFGSGFGESSRLPQRQLRLWRAAPTRVSLLESVSIDSRARDGARTIDM